MVPENTYTCDTQYQQVRAIGREMANTGQQDNNLSSATVPVNANNIAYTCENDGNLTQVRYSDLAINNSYIMDITVPDISNRGVLSSLADVEDPFTAGGQQIHLLPGHNMVWSPRNKLLKGTLVGRTEGENDTECYRYDAGGHHLLKVGTQHTGNIVQTQQVMYQPGPERRRTLSAGKETDVLNAVTSGRGRPGAGAVPLPEE